jgi:hypothetical protein
MFDFKILFAIIFIIISEEIFHLSHVIFIIQFLSTKIQNVNQVFSQIHVRVAYLFLYLRSRYIIMLSQTCRDRTVPYCYRTVPYRMLAHSHSATSLYNLSQFKPISDQFTSIVYILPASNLRTGVVWPRVILCHFLIFTFWLQKYIDFVLFSRAILRAILFRSYRSTWKLTSSGK